MLYQIAGASSIYVEDTNFQTAVQEFGESAVYRSGSGCCFRQPYRRILNPGKGASSVIGSKDRTDGEETMDRGRNYTRDNGSYGSVV